MKDIKSKLLTTLKRYLAILHSISWCSHAQEIPHIFFSTYKKHENLYFKCTYRKVDNKLKRFYMEIRSKNHKTHLSIVACVFISFSYKNNLWIHKTTTIRRKKVCNSFSELGIQMILGWNSMLMHDVYTCIYIFGKTMERKKTNELLEEGKKSYSS